MSLCSGLNIFKDLYLGSKAIAIIEREFCTVTSVGVPSVDIPNLLVNPSLIKRPARDACLCMGDLQGPPAPHFVFLITL